MPLLVQRRPGAWVQGLCPALGTREQTDVSLGKVLNLERSIHGWKTMVHTEFPHKDQEGVGMTRSLVWRCSGTPAGRHGPRQPGAQGRRV